MIKPISLRLHNAEILAKARATLIRAGRGPELERAHTARVMREARATVARAKEQKRLKAVAALAAQKAIVAVRAAYQAQEKVADEFERERWLGLREFVVSELMRIASLPASEPEPEPFYEPQAFNELQADTLAHLINELRDEWRKDHAVEIAELRGQVSALLTLLGQKMGNVPIDTKTEAEVVELLPNWRKNHVA